jgi:deoxycytidylate deaminase
MNKKLFQRCVSLSRDLAEFDHNHAQRHFSFLCIRNKIAFTGVNDKWKTTTLANRFSHLFNAIHSETSAIKAFKYNWSELRHFTMVNVRLNRDLTVMYSKPCKACQRMLAHFDVGEVYYSINETSFDCLI